jgi:hypothetical protein
MGSENLQGQRHVLDIALCLCDDDELFPSRIFVPLYISQGTHFIHCLVANQRTFRVPDFDMLEPHVQPDADAFLRLYEFQDHFVGHTAIGSDADANLFVLQEVLFTGDGVVCPIAPTPFAMYVSGRPTPVAQTRSAKPIPQLKQTVIDKLLEEYPWLRENDLKPAVDRACGRAGASGDGHGSGAGKSLLDCGEDMTEEVLLAAMDELEAARDEHEDCTAEYDHFYFKILGGKWTMAHKGVAADSAGAFARAHVRFWCDLYMLPKSKSYAFKKYGEPECVILAKEFVRRCTFFFMIYLDADDDDVRFQYSDSDKVSYVESIEFTKWSLTLPAFSEVLNRAEELRLMFPKFVP